MAEPSKPQTTTITVFTRHSDDCPRTDPGWKRCKCRKSLYIYEVGKVRYLSAKTRSWEQAEKVAQSERDRRDPEKIALRRIAESEAAKSAALMAGAVSIETALDRWFVSMKISNSGTEKVYIYRSFEKSKPGRLSKGLKIC
jgi:hypothetical protein